MRLNNPDTQFKPGAIRSRRQWMFLGLALGVIAALALNPDTRSIVCRQLATGLPFGRSLDNQVQRIEFGGVGPIDQSVLDAATRAAGNARNDVSLQIAESLFRDMGEAYNASQYQYNADNQSGTAAQDMLKRTRQSAIQEVWRAYPDSPAVSAAYVREFLVADLKNDRTECYWITGNHAPEGLVSDPLPNGLPLTAAPWQHNVLYASQLQGIEQASQSGARSDPQNAFFPMALAYVHYMEHKDGVAIRDVDRAAHCPVFNDYSIDVDRGWQRLDTALYGTPDSNTETGRFEGNLDFACFFNFKKVGQITVWKAIELEHKGFYPQGLALRMRVASVGAAMSRSRPQGLFNGTLTNLVYVSATGPGGNYTRWHTNQNKSEAPYEYAYFCSAAYTQYLEKHGFKAETAWYKPIFKAQYRQASRAYIASTEFGSDNNEAQQYVSRWIQPIAFQAFGYWILAETSLLVIIGIALGLIGYRLRFAPIREVYWTRAQWGTVYAGFLMAVMCLIGCAVIWKGSELWPLIVIVLLGAALVQIGVRRFLDPDSPISLLLQTVSLAICVYIVAGLSVNGLNNLLGALAQQVENNSSQSLPNSMSFALALMVLPALMLCGVAAKCRVRYAGVPSDLFHGTRRIIVPVISILLLVWSVDIAVTVGIQKDVRHSICVNLGLKSESELR